MSSSPTSGPRRWRGPGSDHASLATDNPRLIHCGIVAFGRDGRYANRPAYDPIIQSLSGVAGTFDRAIGEPRFVPMVMTDHITGLIAAQCIGFALFRREKTGVGEAIEVPMFENMASFVMSEHLGAATFDPPEGPTGDARLLSPDYRPLPTKDGYITVRPNTNRQAFAFFDAIGRPELKTDPRFDSAIRAHRERRRLLRPCRSRPWPSAPPPSGWRSSPRRCAGGRYNTHRRPAGGPAPAGRRLLAFRRASDRGPHPPHHHANLRRRHAGGRVAGAALGEHTREMLAEVGYDAAEIDRLLAAESRVIAADRGRPDTSTSS